jgi:N-acetylmuramoyl-L-alanine amidase
MTNLREEKNLRTPAYRQKLADAISDGIVSYINAQ